MIDLREAVYYEYIDDIVVEIFDKYKWGLRRLGVNFSQDLLETIVYCPQNLENTLMAFCSWALWLKSKGERPNSELLAETLTEALRSQSGWIPYDYQKDFLKQHQDILDSPKNFLWKAAKKQLGERLRNRVLADISEEGELLFQSNTLLTDEEKQKIESFKDYIAELYL
ncbi:hypothetical protein [Crocosphaera sp. Alani8]|uniref:hypothetical protein n=1 Tax=Crocosphaera sp. Alani8 TaxID=3038952 RepID=UPI00313BB6E7